MSRAAIAAAYDEIDSRFDEAVVTLMAHVDQPSVSSTGAGIRKSALLVRDRLEACGLRAEIHETGGHPVVTGRREGPAGAPTIAFYGHYDVQPAELSDGWASDPFRAEVRDGRVFGRGAADNKGQHLGVLHGVRALLAAWPELPAGILVVLDGEEEITSPSLAGFLDELRGDLAADLVIVTDGAMHPTGAPTVVRGCRGLLYLDVVARGAERDLHSGTYGGVVPNAATRLVTALAALTRSDVLASGPDDGAGDVVLRPNLNLAGLRGGYQGSGMKTVIPSEAGAKIDCRLVPGQRPEDVAEDVAAVLEEHPGIEVSIVGGTAPYRCAEDELGVDTVTAALADAAGRSPLVVPSLGGTLPLATLAEGLSAPVLLVPLAAHDQNNHGVDENLRLEDYRYAMRAAASMTACFAAGGV